MASQALVLYFKHSSNIFCFILLKQFVLITNLLELLLYILLRLIFRNIKYILKLSSVNNFNLTCVNLSKKYLNNRMMYDNIINLKHNMSYI